MSRLLALVIGLSLIGCHKDDDSDLNDAEHQKFFQSLKLEDFCASLGFLTIGDPGVREDLGHFCTDTQPTELLSSLVKKAWRGDTPFSAYGYEKIEEVENQRSSFLVGFATKIPQLTPIQIRESDLNKALQMQVENELYNISVEEVGRTAGEGLNFLKLQYHYKTLVKGPQSTEFRNERTTEINHFQVTSKREDLALTTETLVEVNKDYDWARTIVLVVADPQNGGSYLISLVNYRTWNQGFHKINTRALDEITKLNAQKAFDYLSTKVVP